jgi:predicted porin
MKVKLLPLAIGAAIAMPGVALADGPTVYGKMNVTFENADSDLSATITETGVGSDSVKVSADTWEMNSNASRLGVKGSEEINDNLSAFYKAEYQIDVDAGDDVFKQRDIFVGLKGGWGAVQLGHFDTPLKKSQGKIDLFNDMPAGDIKNIITGENRESNLIQYSSPKVADALTFNLAVQSGEEYCYDGADSTCQDGPAENFSASVVYDSDMIYAALAMDDGVDGVDATRLTVKAMLDVFEVGVLYQTAEESEGAQPDEEDGYILSAAMKLGSANKIRFQYGSGEVDSISFADSFDGLDLEVDGKATLETTQIALGFDHKLSKQTKLFANYIMLESELTSTGTVTVDDGTGPVSADGSLDIDIEDTRIQFGIEHKF